MCIIYDAKIGVFIVNVCMHVRCKLLRITPEIWYDMNYAQFTFQPTKVYGPYHTSSLSWYGVKNAEAKPD